MDMFNHYYNELDDYNYEQAVKEEELFMEESEMKWAVTDFCNCIQKHGILEMGRLVLEELRNRGYSN